MPETGWGMAYLFALAHGAAADHEELQSYCESAGVAVADFIAEVDRTPDLAGFGIREKISDEIFPAGLKVLKSFRRSDRFDQYVRHKMSLGTASMRELGNLYTAALPAWLAAGLDEASCEDIALAGKEILLVGYGSGDAADAIPIRMVPGWEHGARSIDFKSALLPMIDLTHDQYLALRDRLSLAGIHYAPHSEFVVDRVGSEATHVFQDAGIEYYRFIQ
jgi:hydroxymethylglutaryl-CoA synthase